MIASMRGSSAMILAWLCLGCGASGPPSAEVAPEAEAAPVARRTRVWVLPPLPSDWERWRAPRYLGRDAEGRDLRAIGGVRVAVGPGGIEVAPDGLPARVASAAVTDAGLWVFLLEDGHLWRSAGALAEPEHVARVTSPRRMEQLADSIAPAQRGQLAVAGRGNAYGLDGSWPVEPIASLPRFTARQMIGLGEQRLIALLTGGVVVLSHDRGQSWQAVRDGARSIGLRDGHVVLDPDTELSLPIGEVAPVPAPHAPPPAEALLRAVLARHPRAAQVVGVPLPGGGSVIGVDDEDVVVVRPDGRATLRWSVHPPGCSLHPWYGRVIAVPPEGRLRLSEDGTSFGPPGADLVDSSYAIEPTRLRCDYDAYVAEEGPGRAQVRSRCLVDRDGEARRVDWGEATLTATAAWRIDRSEDGLLIRDAADPEAEPAGTLPPTASRDLRVTWAGDGTTLIAAPGVAWTHTIGAEPLPPDTSSVAAFDAERLLAWGETTRTLVLRDPEGEWIPLAADGPPIPLRGYEATCARGRCVLRHDRGVTVLVELGESRAPPRTRVATMPEEELRPWPRRLRVPRLHAEPMNSFGRISLRCETTAARRPDPPPGAVTRVELDEETVAWSGSGYSTRTHPRRVARGPIRAAIGDRERALVHVGTEVLQLGRDQPVARFADDRTFFDGARLDDGSWLVFAGRRGGARYTRWSGHFTDGFTQEYVSPRPCFGLARRHGRWGPLLCAGRPGAGAWFDPQQDGIQLPQAVALPGLRYDDAPMPICAGPTEDEARLDVWVDSDEVPTDGIARVGLPEDAPPCLHGIELRGLALAGPWNHPGQLVAEGGRLVGVVRSREGDGWVRARCETVPSSQ